MKNISRLYILPFISFVLMIPVVLLADTGKSKQISICGQTDSAVSVEVITHPEFYISPKRNTVIYNCQVTDKQFAIRLPAYNKPVYISIYINYVKRRSVVLFLYIIEAGDSVYIKQDPDGLKFSGKSAAKFLCQYRIINAKPPYQNTSIEKDEDAYENIKKGHVIGEITYNLKKEFLDSIKTSVSANFYSLLKTDLFNEKLQNEYIFVDFCLRLTSKDPLKQQQVINYYKNNLMQKEIPEAEASVALISRYYTDAILSKFKLDGVMQYMNYTPGRYTGSSPVFVCREIAARYAETLKEKLLTTYFVNQFNISDSASVLINNAIKEFKHPYLRNSLLEVQRKAKGVKAYNFALPDSSDKMVKLSDFKGKAVFLDFWYTGCHWCTVFTKEIKPFVESNQDTNIVFITISIDKNKESWKESIRQGLYTSGNEINLYTNGMGNQHPVITYNMICCYPATFIIDKKGKIFSVEPTVVMNGETTIMKLQKALNGALRGN